MKPSKRLRTMLKFCGVVCDGYKMQLAVVNAKGYQGIKSKGDNLICHPHLSLALSFSSSSSSSSCFESNDGIVTHFLRPLITTHNCKAFTKRARREIFAMRCDLPVEQIKANCHTHTNNALVTDFPLHYFCLSVFIYFHSR